jgi:antitoxin component HigA of HigAB toxin-antitoxin module
MTKSSRETYTQGLREIADFLDAHPEVPLPYLSSFQTGNWENTLDIYLVSEKGQKEKLAAIARAMGHADKVMDGDKMRVFRRFAGITLIAQASRDQVCERVVIGTREIEVEEKDPEALAAVPVVKVTKTVEDVEWRCAPILAAEKQAAEDAWAVG